MNSLPPPFTEQLSFVFVADLERSHAFYADTLGLPMALDQGMCRIYRVTETAYLGICERPDEVSPGGVILTLVTDAVDAWHRRISDAGTPVVQAPRLSEEYRVYHAFYRDPDGYLVETQQFRDPAWDARPGPRRESR